MSGVKWLSGGRDGACHCQNVRRRAHRLRVRGQPHNKFTSIKWLHRMECEDVNGDFGSGKEFV